MVILQYANIKNQIDELHKMWYNIIVQKYFEKIVSVFSDARKRRLYFKETNVSP